MDYKSVLENLEKEYELKAIKFTKEEQKFNTGKDSFRGAVMGCFTRNYHCREKLFLSSEIHYGYTFKTWTNEKDLSKPYPTWLLYSPLTEFQDDPTKYKKVVEAISDIANMKLKDRKEKRFKTLIIEELADAEYFEIPPRFTEGKLVYLSIIYFRPNQIPMFKLGVNLVIANKTISKEIVYLPYKYFTDEYLEYYAPERMKKKKEVNSS